MSIFTESNKDSATVWPDQAAAAPRLGFMGAFEAAYDTQVRASSQFGVEAFLREAEQENRRRIRSAGGDAPPSLNDSEDSEYIPRMMGGSGFTAGLNSGKYMDYARAAAAGDDISASSLVGDRNDRLAKLKEQYPNAGIQTYSDMFADVRRKAQEAERLEQTSPHSLAGYVGGFLGGAVGGMDLRVNPLNFITTPLGAAGTTALTRIAGQGLVQGGIETLNQVTGVQENRRVLGLQSGFGNALGNVAGAAIGGAALQGIGEGVAAIGGRWFRNAPHDPAPPAPVFEPRVETGAAAGPATGGAITVPADTAARIAAVVGPVLRGEATPLARTRMGASRATADLDHVFAAMERWDSPAPWEIPPTTATRPFAAPDAAPRIELPTQLPDASIDARARALDPEAFATYDKLASDVVSYRARIADAETIREQARLAAVADETTQQIETLRGQLAGVEEGSKRAQRLNDQINELEASRPSVPDDALPDAKAQEAALRGELMKTDERMRDMAEVISRAYARARGEWEADSAIRAQVDDMLARGAKELPAAPVRDIGEMPGLSRSITIADSVPELRRAASRGIVAGPNDTALDITAKVQVAEAKLAEAQVERTRREVTRLLSDENARIEVEGVNATLGLSDRINIEGPDGNMRTVTVREALQAVQEDTDVLKAVTSCRLNPTS